MCKSLIKPTQTKIQNTNGTSANIILGDYRPKLPNDGYYALIEKNNNKTTWSVLQIGTAPIRRSSDEQEVLFLSNNAEWAQPAYEYEKSADNSYFNCMALIKENNRYSPCGSTRFSTISETSTAFRNAIFTPLSMGTMAGTNRIIDTKAISEALQQTGLVDQIKQISLARADTENYLAFADGAVSRNIAKLIDAAKNLAIEPQITNKTGFPTPENSHWVDRINFSAAKPTTKTLIRNQFKTSGTFGSTAEMLDNLKNIKSSVDTIIESRTNATQINLSCPPTTIERFNTTLNCPAYIDAEAILNKTPIPLFVNYVSYNAGTRTPEIMLRDKAINVSTADGSLQIENITSDFIEVHDVTCYVGPSARTRSWSANHYLSIPPHTHLTDGDATLLLSETCRPIDAPLTFNRITQSMLTNRNMSFGIAIRYRKAGESTDHTLVDTKTFNALALVQRTN